MAVQVVLNTPLADQLGHVVQPKLEEMGWTTGGLDDSALAEYVILMLVNGKTQDQIAAELSNDLLNLGPEDSGAIDFSRWLFEQVETIHERLNSKPAVNGTQLASAVSVPNVGQNGIARAPEPDSPDTEMGDGDAMEYQDTNMYVHGFTTLHFSTDLSLYSPTGPKSMRNGPRQQNRRLMGQLTKAMDRSGDSALHRVKSQGSERINKVVGMRGLAGMPPKGPRNSNTRSVGQPSMPNGAPRGPGGLRGQNAPQRAAPNMPTQMTPQQQMALFQMYEQQARIMSEILSPGQQQMMMSGMPAPAINPNFRPTIPQGPQQPGRSLFDRVENNPRRQTSFHNRANASSTFTKQTPQTPQDTEMTNGDLAPSSMDVEDARSQPSDLGPDTVCKFNLKCTKADCIFAHQSPSAPYGTTIDVHDTCSFGAACQNRKCTGRHPSPATRANFQATQDCKFFPNCTNPSCPFRHPSLPVCRNGADCKKPGCKFTHVQIKCKFHPCLNPQCVYKHDEGQRGKFGDKVWKAGSEDGAHVSERKFTTAEEKDEELIIGNLEDGKDEGMGVLVGGEQITA